jgi:hypothetical protein
MCSQARLYSETLQHMQQTTHSQQQHNLRLTTCYDTTMGLPSGEQGWVHRELYTSQQGHPQVTPPPSLACTATLLLLQLPALKACRASPDQHNSATTFPAGHSRHNRRHQLAAKPIGPTHRQSFTACMSTHVFPMSTRCIQLVYTTPDSQPSFSAGCNVVCC